MGWVRARLARETQPVEGLIVAHEQELQLADAVSAVPNLSVVTYSVDFTLSAPAPLEDRALAGGHLDLADG